MATFRTDKDDNAVLDYRFDWANATNGGAGTDWLASGETIDTHTVTVDTGITVDSSQITDSSTSVTVWLSGGTAGNIYNVACRISTNAGRTDERTLAVRVKKR